jgi:hypothetical protein
MAKKKKPTSTLLKAKTPDREANEATKLRKKQGKRVRQTFNRDHLAEAETASKEDFSQAAARIVREATKEK